MKFLKLLSLISFLLLIFLIQMLDLVAQTSRVRMVEYGGVTYELEKCEYAGGLVNCHFLVTSRGRDRSIEAVSGFSWKPKLTDNFGNTFEVKSMKFANFRDWEANLVADLPTPMIVTSDFDASATEIALIELEFVTESKGYMVKLRNIIVEKPTATRSIRSPIFETNGVTFILNECRTANSVLTCDLEVTSHGKNRLINQGYCIGCRSSRVVDNFGNQYEVKKFVFGNQERRAELIADTPTRMRFTSEGFSSNVTEIALIDLVIPGDESFVVQFRKIPVNSGVSGNFISPNNVAYKKPVFITTNGAEDISDAGNNCNNPNEITDGILLQPTSICANDGVVGFQNHDYNQLMELTVTINLQQTYNITKIRYNQGNVQRAETWNADVITTPFGKIRAVSGSTRKGSWTEQTGSFTTSKLVITFQKTRKKWEEDWLYIGEIEVIGSLTNSKNIRNDPVNNGTVKSNLAKTIENTLAKKGFALVTVKVTPNLIILQGCVPKGKFADAITVVQSVVTRNIRSELRGC